MRSLTAAALIVLMAACDLPGPAALGPEAWTEPPDEAGPVELIGVMTEAIHAGDSGVWLVPAGRTAPPAFCVAYLDGTARESDNCSVEARPFEWDEDTYPWVIRAWWIGLFVWDEPVTVHAFDDRGRPLAHWEGRMHEHAGHLTE